MKWFRRKEKTVVKEVIKEVMVPTTIQLQAEKTKNYNKEIADKIKKMRQKDNEYLESLYHFNDKINDSIHGLKGSNEISIDPCVADVYQNYKSYQELSILAQGPLMSMIVKTISNEAARELPNIDFVFVDERKNLLFEEELQLLRSKFEYKVNSANLPTMLKKYIKYSKIFGVVNILKKPKKQLKKQYWKNPFNIDAVDSDIEFVLLDTDRMRPFLGVIEGITLFNAVDDHQEPEYWQIPINEEMVIVHKTHLIRVVEEEVFGRDCIRRRYRGVSLVESLSPLTQSIREAEKMRLHCLHLQGILAVHFPTEMVQDQARVDCSGLGEGESLHPYDVSRMLAGYFSIMDTSVAKAKMIPLLGDMSIENVNVSLSEVNANIESLYYRLAAQSTLPVSYFGLVPPRGLNDSGAVEADGSRRAIESNQNTILRPILHDILKIFLQETMNELGLNHQFLVQDFYISINFKPANATTAVDESTIIKNDADTVISLYQAGAISADSLREFLMKRHEGVFDHLQNDDDLDDDDNQEISDKDREELRIIEEEQAREL